MVGVALVDGPPAETGNDDDDDDGFASPPFEFRLLTTGDGPLGNEPLELPGDELSCWVIRVRGGGGTERENEKGEGTSHCRD